MEIIIQQEIIIAFLVSQQEKRILREIKILLLGEVVDIIIFLVFLTLF